MQSSALCRSRRELSNAYLLQNLASIQLLTSLVKFARSPCRDPPGGRKRPRPAGFSDDWDAIQEQCRADGGSILTVSGIPRGLSKDRIGNFFRGLGAIGIGNFEGMGVQNRFQQGGVVPLSVRVAVPKDTDFEGEMAARSAELYSAGLDGKLYSAKKERTLAVIERDGQPVLQPAHELSLPAAADPVVHP